MFSFTLSVCLGAGAGALTGALAAIALENDLGSVRWDAVLGGLLFPGTLLVSSLLGLPPEHDPLPVAWLFTAPGPASLEVLRWRRR